MAAQRINPIDTSEKLRETYLRYLTTIFGLKNPELARQFHDLAKKSEGLFKGPILEATPKYRKDKSLLEMLTVEHSVLSDQFLDYAPDLPENIVDKALDLERKLYTHQGRAIRKVVGQNRNIVVATGTGSGKTECFLLPIIDHLLKERAAKRLGPGVRALLVYPMNALANDQVDRLRRLLPPETGLTFGRYTGQTMQTYGQGLSAYPVSYTHLDVYKRQHMNFTPIGGVLQTNTQDLDVGPTLDSWKLTTTDRDKKPSDRHTVEAHLPGSDSGEKVPLFVFSRTTGKLVDMSRRNPLQEELLLVYPKDSAVEIQGGCLASEPESLTGLWFEWQFALCVIEESGTFCYRGLGADFGKNILAKIQFVFNRLEDRPVLGGAGQAPPWLRCLEEYPIFTDTKDIAITYPGWSYTIWRRAFVKLTRRNQDGFIKQLDLEPSSDGQMYAASINFPKNWGPGVYELSLRGPLGYDDIVLPFVYLPLKKLEQAFEPGTGLAYEFRFTNAKGISMEPLNSTVIRNLGQMTFLSSTDDDRALLGVKTFVQSSCPVILLFARSNLRWSRRSERGLFLWEEWRCKPEEIPVQKVEEIVDALVAVQLDGTGEIFNRGDKLKLLLKTPLEEGGEERTLFSYDAFTLRRNIHDTWVFNLRKFAEMVKSLRSVETATITVYSPDDRRELLLFTMRKHPIFKDFKVETTCRAGMGERLKISWKPQKNDPQTHRVIHIYPIDEPRGVKVNKIVDGALPPFEMELSPVQRPGLWCLKPVVQHSRFSTSCTCLLYTSRCV